MGYVLHFSCVRFLKLTFQKEWGKSFILVSAERQKVFCNPCAHAFTPDFTEHKLTQSTESTTDQRHLRVLNQNVELEKRRIACKYMYVDQLSSYRFELNRAQQLHVTSRFKEMITSCGEFNVATQFSVASACMHLKLGTRPIKCPKPFQLSKIDGLLCVRGINYELCN